MIYHHGGAHEDVRKHTGNGWPNGWPNGWSALRIALHNNHVDVVKWLILNKALSPPRDDVAGGGIDDAIMRHDLNQEVGDNWQDDRRLPLLSWARDAVTNHDTVVKVLLTGMIVRSNQTSSSLEVFKGKSGILELIAHYVVGTPHQVRTLRQLIDRLPAFIVDVPFVPFVEEEEEDDDEDDY